MAEEKNMHVSATLISPDENTHESNSNTNTHNATDEDRSLWLKICIFAMDVLLALSPLLFLGIAIAAIAYNHKLVHDDQQNSVELEAGHYNATMGGQSVIDAANVAVSIFPILFAAVVGRFMKAYALHRAEHGSQMGTLEQLYGSQSLSNAVQLTCALRGPGFLGFAVVFLWLLSPLGGQGVKRVLNTTTRAQVANSTVFYCNSSAPNSAFSSRRGDAFASTAMDSILSAVLMTKGLVHQNDIWGNVKIPYMASLRVPGQDMSQSTWLNNTSNSTSSSLVGHVINNIAQNASTSFNMTTSYISLTCQDPKQFTYIMPDIATENGTIPTNMTGYNDFLAWLGPVLSNEMTNDTNTTADDSSSTSWSDWQYLVDVRSNGSYSSDSAVTKTFSKPPQFVFAAQSFYTGNGSDTTIFAYECTSSIDWVQASIDCPLGGLCTVMGMRASEPPQDASEHGLLQELSLAAYPVEPGPLTHLLTFLNGYGNLLQLGIQVWGQSSALCLYFSGADPYPTNEITSSGSETGSLRVANYSTVTGADISSRLGTMINTAWLTSLQYTSTAAGQITNVTLLSRSDPHSPDYQLEYIGYDVISSNAETSIDVPIYVTNWAWVTVAIAISCLLLVLGFVGLYYRYTNKNPDILGYVSTLTRYNPEFDPPPRADKFSGLEMASHFKHMTVQLVNKADANEEPLLTLRQYRRRSGDLPG